MTAILWMLFTLTLSGSALAVLVLCLSPFLRRRPAVRYYLWLLVVLRLLLPFAPEANLMARLAEQLERTEVQFTPVRMDDPPAVPEVQAPTAVIVYVPVDGEDPYAEESRGPAYHPTAEVVSGIAQTTRRLAAFGAARVILFIWLFGAGAALLPYLWGFYRMRILLRRTGREPAPEEQALLDTLCTGRRKPRLYRCGAAHTPMTFGILRPVIALPECTYTPDELRYILLHELTHVRRFDVVYKWMVLAATGIHWFNPLVRYLERTVSRTCEQSCDAAVVRGLDLQERVAYCRTLLQAAAAGQRRGFPAAALGAGAEALKARMEAALSYRGLGKKGRAGCALLLMAVAALGMLLGCSNGEAVQASAVFADGNPAADGSDTAAITRLCREWAEAIVTQDLAARTALLENPEALPEGYDLFAPVWGHRDRYLRSYDFDMDAEWGWLTIYYEMEDDDLNLYRLYEHLILDRTEDGWRVREQVYNEYHEASSYGEWTGIPDEGTFIPQYTESDLRRMEAGHIGLYGLDAGDAAEKALHLTGGRMIRVTRADGRDGMECWYHWEDGDTLIQMVQAEGHSIWVPKSAEPVRMNVGSYLEARSFILNGLPGGWETEDLGADEQAFRCGVYGPDGALRCILRVDWHTGEIFWEEDSTGRLRPYHESPINDTLERRSTWEGEFYPYQKEKQRTIIRKIGDQVFSYVRPDGTSGMGNFSGNQGWTDDGKYLFLWCADGCNLKIYPRQEDGTLLWNPEELQSDLFDVRYRERWEQNYGGARAAGIAADEARELLECALPDGYTAQQQPNGSDWHRFNIEKDGEPLCMLAVSSLNAEIRAWDEQTQELRPYSESPIYPMIAERCAWEGPFAEAGVPGVRTFWREAEDGLGYSLTGAATHYHTRISANQAFSAELKEMYLWDCETGDILVFELGDNGEIYRSDGEYYARLTRCSL